MKLWIFPPHRDVTLSPRVEEGWAVVDVARQFVGRCVSLSSDQTAQPSAPLEASAGAADSRTARLRFRAARALLARPDAHPHTHLRAWGVILEAASAPPSAVRLRLDDLMMEGGSTERSSDVSRRATLPAPYDFELQTVETEFLPRADRVRLWLETDLQLLAAERLACACPAGVPLEVAGPFVAVHGSALRGLPGLARAIRCDASVEWRVGEGMDALGWVPRPGQASASGSSLWGGYLRLEDLLEPESRVAQGCRVAVVGLCGLTVDGAELLSSEGSRVPVAVFERGAATAHALGVQLVFELWVGAPGVDAAGLERALTFLERRPLFDCVAGVRAFHWAAERPAGPFGEVEVTLHPKAPEEGWDLARTVPFRAPRTLSGGELASAVEAALARLLRRSPLCPGRLAGAYTAPPPQPLRGGGFYLDRDCVVLEESTGVGRVADSDWYAVNLRTGRTLRIDARLARAVEVWHTPASPERALASLPADRRGAAADLLQGAGVLARAAA